MMLPGGMSGLELLNAIRKDHAVLPVLFMTGYSNDAVANDPAFQGVRLLPKPFTETALSTAVLEALREGATAAQGLAETHARA
jgi:CheY-like chemotaxis protein